MIYIYRPDPQDSYVSSHVKDGKSVKGSQHPYTVPLCNDTMFRRIPNKHKEL